MEHRSLRWKPLSLLVLAVGLVAGLLWLLRQEPHAAAPQGAPQEAPSSPRLASPKLLPDAAAPSPAVRQELPAPSPLSPPPVGEQEDPVARSQFIRSKALEYKQGRNNIFFKERDFLQDFVRSGPGRIEALKAELLSPRGLEELPPDVRYLQQNQQPILERMGMVDMLEGLAREDRQALQALAEVAQAPIDASLPPHVRRALLGDKFDALVGLARVDRDMAFKVFSQLQPASLKTTLRPALISGLVDTGVPPPEAVRMTDSLL